MIAKTRGILHFFALTGLAVFVFMVQTCASDPTVPVELGASYREYLQQPIGNERKFDEVRVKSSASFVCRDTQHAVTNAQVLGVTYQVSTAEPKTGLAGFFSAPQGPKRSTDRHDQEPIFDQLLSAAKAQYPSEKNITIRNARTGGHIPTNARQEEYNESVKGNDGKYYTVKKTRPLWDCFLYYVADVVTTEPMPKPVAHTETFTMKGSTRNDNFRRTQNWLEDNAGKRRITIDSRDFDVGRIKGTVTCAAITDHPYKITSNFTIDVYDAKIEVKFAEATLQRTDPSQQRAGPPEPIFLQSIADAALAELVDFSTSLRSYIISQ